MLAVWEGRASAAGAVSVEEGVDKIRLGKALFAVAGGFDDLGIEGIVGFGAMSATADSAKMTARGIDDRRFSRANDRRRGGFVESAGGGDSHLSIAYLRMAAADAVRQRLLGLAYESGSVVHADEGSAPHLVVVHRDVLGLGARPQHDERDAAGGEQDGDRVGRDDPGATR